MPLQVRKRNPIFKALNGTAIDLPVARNISILWNFGFLLAVSLSIQILTGIILSTHYTATIEAALRSVNAHIGRDVNEGWLLRSCHANTAGAFLICIYLHVARGLYLGSYNNFKAWAVGVAMLLLSMATAFLGYVLVWGNMRYWAATVITNLLTALSYLGQTLAEWVWGDYGVGRATLSRLFSFHYLCPFILLGITVVHLILIHQKGSSNPTGLNRLSLKVPLHQYFTVKDGVALLALILFIGTLAFLFPTSIGDCENYNYADPLVTPAHIKPELYFLWAYAILRSVPNKLGGVVLILTAVLLLLAPSFLNTYKPGCRLHPIRQILLWIFVVNFILLSYIGACPVEPPYEGLGQVFSLVYFAYFILDPIAKTFIHKRTIEI